MKGAYQNPVHELTLILDCGFLYFITWQANVELSAFKSFLIIVSMQYNIDVIKISDKIHVVNLIDIVNVFSGVPEPCHSQGKGY